MMVDVAENNESGKERKLLVCVEDEEVKEREEILAETF